MTGVPQGSNLGPSPFMILLLMLKILNVYYFRIVIKFTKKKLNLNLTAKFFLRELANIYN